MAGSWGRLGPFWYRVTPCVPCLLARCLFLCSTFSIGLFRINHRHPSKAENILATFVLGRSTASGAVRRLRGLTIAEAEQCGESLGQLLLHLFFATWLWPRPRRFCLRCLVQWRWIYLTAWEYQSWLSSAARPIPWLQHQQEQV